MPLAFAENPVRLNSMNGMRNRTTIQTPVGQPYQPPRKTYTTQNTKRPRMIIRAGLTHDSKAADAINKQEYVGFAYFDAPESSVMESAFIKAYKTTRPT